MSDRARNVMLLALTVFGVVLAIGAFIALRGGVDNSASKPQPNTGVATALATATTATEPFSGLTSARLGVGGRCLHIVIADADTERVAGLRDVTDLGDYDGMLFVYGSDTDARFTMSGTPLPLDIGWYAADGTPVDRTTMTPCIDGSDASCPVYASSGRYRYALETPAGQGGAGAIGACPA